jgi:hypothetical protein
MSLAPYQSLTLDELVRQFRETARLLGTAIKLPPNFDKFKQTPERRARVEIVRALGAEFAARDAIPSVRRESAIACLAVDPDRAVAVLESIAEMGDQLESIEAKDSLDRYRQQGGRIIGRSLRA